MNQYDLNDSMLIEKIIHLYNNDNEDPKDQSRYLANKYYEATQKEKDSMDIVSICICGYSIKSILAKKEEIESILKETSFIFSGDIE